MAVELSLAIQGDDDVACAHQLIVTEALLHRQKLDEAETLARRISDHRAGVALAKCAEALLAGGGDAEHADKLLDESMTRLGRSNPAGANSVRLQVAVVREMQGRTDEAAHLCESITDKEVRTTARLLREIVALRDEALLNLDKWRREIESVSEKAPFPSAVEASRRKGERGLKQLREAKTDAQKTAALACLAQADELADLSLVAHAEALLPVALELLVTKESRTANRLIMKAATEVKHMPPSYDLKAILSASLARCWHLSGKTSGAVSLLEQGEELVSSLPSMDQPRALAHLAAGWQHLERGGQRERLFDRAVSVASENPNPRNRVLAALEVCLAHDSAGLALSDDMATRLRALAALP